MFGPWLEFLYSKLVVLTVERNFCVYGHACMLVHMCMYVCAHVCAYVIAEWWGPFPRNYKTLGIQGRIRKEMAYSNESPLGRLSLQSEVLEDVGVGRKCRERPSGEGRKGWCDLEGEAYGEVAFRVTFSAEVRWPGTWPKAAHSLLPPSLGLVIPHWLTSIRSQIWKGNKSLVWLQFGDWTPPGWKVPERPLNILVVCVQLLLTEA